MKHSANLDILRSFAVVTVMIDHLTPTLALHTGFHNQAILNFTAQIGHAGVLAFFVHTSLVLMYSLERMHTTTDRVTIPFYIRRFFRIYPLAIFAVLTVLLLHIPAFTWKPATPLTTPVIVANFLLIQNIFTKQYVLGPLWSLPYEIQMYIVLPALYLLARRRRGPSMLAGLIAFFYMVGAVLGYRTGHLNMAAYIPCFLCGVLCYSLRNRIRQNIPAILWPPLVLTLISVFALANRYDYPGWLGTSPTFWSGWLFSLALGLAINVFYDSRSRAGNFLANKTALYSYGMYLAHVPVLYLIFMKLHIQYLPLGVPLFFVLTAVISIATFHLIESPFVELGKKLTANRRLRREPALEPVMPAI